MTLNAEGGPCEIVGEEDEAVLLLVIKVKHPKLFVGIGVAGALAAEYDCLVANQAGGFVYRM